MAASPKDTLHGTLDALILKTLSWGPRHGYAITRWLREVSDDAVRVEEGSLYPALYRMARKGWIRGEWGVSENNRRAKYYLLTPAGERELARERSQWERSSAAVNWVLAWTGGAA